MNSRKILFEIIDKIYLIEMRGGRIQIDLK